MKYLKTFNESSSKSSLAKDIQWIEDVLLELTDMGHKVNIKSYSVYGVSHHSGLQIKIESKNDRLLPIFIGECLLTINSYLSEKGYLMLRFQAGLKGIDNKYGNDLSQFVKMLDRFGVNAPFDSISVYYYNPEVKPVSEKYSRFNENSYDLYTNTISDCKDILLDLTDRGIRCDVEHFDNVDKFKIEIEASERSKVRLGDFSPSFEHLLSYLESRGYILDSKGSFYENDDWDYYESCPKCGSTNVSFVGSDDDSDINNWECGKCGKVGEQDYFMRPEHPLGKSELLNSIRNNYYIDFMYLVFLKKTS